MGYNFIASLILRLFFRKNSGAGGHIITYHQQPHESMEDAVFSNETMENHYVNEQIFEPSSQTNNSPCASEAANAKASTARFESIP